MKSRLHWRSNTLYCVLRSVSHWSHDGGVQVKIDWANDWVRRNLSSWGKCLKNVTLSTIRPTCWHTGIKMNGRLSLNTSYCANSRKASEFVNKISFLTWTTLCTTYIIVRMSGWDSLAGSAHFRWECVIWAVWMPLAVMRTYYLKRIVQSLRDPV